MEDTGIAPGHSKDRIDALRFAEVIDEVVAFIGLLSPEGNLVQINDPALVVSGLSRADVIGKPFWECPWWNDDPARQRKVREAVETARQGRSVRFDTAVRIADDAMLEIDFQISPHYDKSGDLLALVPSAVDISERRKVETALRSAVDTLHSVVRESPFGVILIDGDFRIDLVSVGAERSLKDVMPVVGRDLGEVMREAWDEPFGSEVVAIYRAVLENGTPFTTSDTVEKRSGGDIESYDWRVERIVRSDGRYGLVCYFYDLTERDRIQAQLLDSERMFRATFENAAIGMAHVAADGSWLRVNETLVRILGIEKDDLLKKRFQDLTHPDDLDADLELFRELISGERDRYVLEKRYVFDDAPIWIRLTVGCVRDPEGRFEYAISCIEDISDRKRAEARQQILVAELNHRVGNILATVGSMAASTVRAAEDLPDFKEKFGGRLQSIAKAHRSVFSNDLGSASIAEIVEDQLALYIDPADPRIELSGPKVPLDAERAHALALLLHELATNALKHGGLSEEEGGLSVTWERRSQPEGGRVAIHWKERTARTLKEPEREGFGSKLIASSLTSLSGEMSRDYRPHGLSCEITFAER